MTECVRIESDIAVISTLQKRNLPLDSLIKLLIVGNSGAGRSFSLNCLCEKDLFSQDEGGGGVTIENERVLIFIPEYPPILAYNIPGLLEADEERVAANKLQISMAFREFPESKLACVFMFSGGGGRVLPEEVNALGAVLAFIGLTPDRASEFFTTVMNRFSPNDDSEEAWLKYKCGAETLMNATLGNQGSVIPLTPLPHLSGPERKLGSAARDSFKRQLQVAVAPVIVKARRLLEIIPVDREIVLEEEKLKASLAETTARHSAAQAAMEKRHDEMVTQMSDRIEQLKQESKQLALQLQQPSSQSPWGDILGGVAKIVSASADAYRASQTKK